MSVDYGQNEWCASAAGADDRPPISSLNRLGGLGAANNSIPLPTLYSAEGHRKPKPSITELVMYNMASMLASVATGYDVRMSNVSPVHPRLQPQLYHRNDDDDEDIATLDDDFVNGDEYSGGVNDHIERGGFSHSTYHGPSRHMRCVCLYIMACT